jgi:transposase-like protein
MIISDESKKLRTEVGVLRRDRRRRYPPDLRRRILEWVERHVQDGGTETECAVTLGMKVHRFHQWRDQVRERATAAPTAELVPVEIVGPRSNQHGHLVLVAPSGCRVEGLTVAEALELLEALR